MLILTSVGTLVMLLFQPLWELLVDKNPQGALNSLGWSALFFLPFLLIYYVNHFFLIRKFLFEQNNSKKFWAFNFLVVFVLYCLKNVVRVFIGDFLWTDFFALLVPNFMIGFMVIGTALGIKYYFKSVEDLEKEKENQKAELQWLKNQLNPHFLFNTMNNISAQIYTNPDEAQENLSRLSAVLRYALYETQVEKVPLKGEIEFMEDYISLMKLRCSDKTTVTVNFDCEPAGEKILPLLYVSLIENAFKHGISNKEESFIKVSLKKSAENLDFTVENSNFPKNENRSGSGIGLENLKRRLELAYGGNYKFSSGVTGGTYLSKLIIKL